jgi:hypothetical protein
MQCSVSPATIAPSESGSTVTVKVVTIPTKMTSPAAASLILGFAIFGFAGIQRRCLWKRGVVCAVLLISLAGMVACGAAMNHMQTDGTPKGTYTLSLVATSGALSHSQTFNVTVR